MRKFYTAVTKKLSLLFFVLGVSLGLLPSSTLLSQTVVPYNTPGSYTFTVPIGVTSITVSTWGGGGAGGGVNGVTGTAKAGGGGEGGSFVRGTITVVPLATYTIVVGSGGTGVLSVTGGAGQASSFSVTAGATLFRAIGGTGGGAGSNFGAGGNTANSGNIISGSSTSNFYGGNGGTATTASTASSGGGGGSAGAGSNGGNGGSPLTAGTAGTGSGVPADAGVAGAAGRGSGNDGNGLDAVSPGAGGSGARNANNATDYRGGNGGSGRITIAYNQLTYRSRINSISFGTSAWCVGETREVTVSVTNMGTATWTDANPDINIGLKWDSDPDFGAAPGNIARQNAGNLAPGATASYTFSVVTPVIASGADHLSADVVYEAVAWFRGNTPTGIGPGNSMFVSPAITIVALPGAPTGSGAQSFCISSIPNPTVANLSATGTTIKWYAATTGGTSLATSTALVSGTTYYASQTNASGCESSARLAVTATINDPAAPTGVAAQSFCAINNPTVTSLSATGAAIKWYANPTGGTALAPGTAIVNGTHYYASQTVAGCESATRLDVTVSVDNPAAPTGAAAPSFCSIDNPTLASLTVSGTDIKWYTAATGGSLLPIGTDLVNGTHYYASQTIAGCESASRLDIIATVTNPGAPAGSALQVFCSAANPTVADLLPPSPTVQWYAVATGGSPLASSTPLVDGTHYFAAQIVGGCEGTPRLDVTVIIHTAVSIVTEPVPLTQTVCATFPAGFTVVGAGDIASYQWYRGTTALTDNSNINGSQTASLLIDQASAADQGMYHVVIKGTGPCSDVTSIDVELQVNTNITVTTQPAPQTLCIGDAAVFSVIATGTDLTYQWRKGATVLADGGNISGATTSTLTIANLVAGDAGNYNVLISDGSAGCPNTNSINALLTINPTSVGGTVSGTTAVCSGTNSGSMTLSGRTGNILNWEFSTDNGVSWTTISNTTATQTFSNLITTTIYRAVVKNGVCVPVNSTEATITVNPIPDAVASVPAQTICSGTAITTIELTGAVGGTTFNWVRTPVAGITGIGTTGSGDISATLTNTTALPITVTFTITPTALTCVGTPITATVLVNPTPVAVATPASQTKCSGVAITTIVLSSTTTGTTYTWTRDNSASVTGIADNGSGNIAGTLTNTTSAPELVTFTITPSANGCDGNSIAATVLVNPTPDAIATPASQTICSGGAISTISFSGAVTGTTYAWTRTAIAGITSTIAASGSGSINGTLTNTTAAPITVSFTIIPTANTCPGASITATVTVNPSPVVTRTPAAQTICSGADITPILLTSTTAGSSFTWTRNNTASVTGIAASGSGDISGSLTNTTFAPLTVTFTITATANGCPGVVNTATVLVNPTPNVLISNASQTRCSGIAFATMALTTNATGVTTTYAWTRDNVGTVTGPAASGSGASIAGTLTNTTAAPITVTFTVTPTANGCPGTPSTATILVNPTPNVVAAPATQTVCSGSPITTIVLTGNTGGTVFNWTSAGTPTGIANSNGDISGTLVNATNAVANETFTIIPTANGCAGPSTTAVVTVRPTPVVTVSTAANVCQGSTASVTFTNLINLPVTVTYNVDGGANATVNINANASANVPQATTTAGSFTYNLVSVVYQSAPTCSNTLTGSATVVVRPTPTATISGTNTLCEDGATSQITFSNPMALAITVTYRINTGFNQTINVPANGTASVNAAVGTAGTFTYEIRSVAYQTGSVCSTTITGQTAVITVRPTPTATISGTTTVCRNTPSPAVTFTNPRALPVTITYRINTGATTTINVAANGTATIAAPTTAFGTFNYNLVSVVYQTAPTCSANITGTATINVDPSPTGTLSATETSGLANDDDIICIGAPVTFTATSGYGSYIFKVNGLQVQSGISNIYSSSSLTNGASVTVDVANGFNCGSTFGPVAITVNPLPTPTLSSSDANNIICAGDTVTFTAGGGVNYTFLLNGSVVQTSTSDTYETYELANGDVIQVVVSNANGCRDTSAPITTAVNALPAGSVTPGAAEICANASITFTAPGSFSSYTFFADGVIVQGPSTTTTYTATFTAPAIITVGATNAAGCYAVLDTIVVNVNTLPSGTLTATENSGIANDNNICAGSAVNFTATIGYSTYNFKINGTSAQSGSSHTFSRSNLSDNDVVTVDVSSGDGCNATFGPITIDVVAAPAASLVVAPGLSVCAGATVTFTAPDVMGNNYRFILNGTTTLQNGTSNSFSSTTLADGSSITVEVTNSNSCISVSNPSVVTLSPAPTTTLTAVETSGNTPNDGIICTGASITLTAPTGFTNYNFLFNGVSVQNGASNTYTPAIVTSGQQYTVAITNSGDCIGLSNQVTITVNPLPPVVNPITGDLSFCVNATSQLTTTTTGGVWSSSDNAVATVDLTGNVVGISAGSVVISYTVTNANGCQQIATATLTINALPVVAVITGTPGACIGFTSQLSNVTPGGVWSSADDAIATVGITGLVSGVSSGSVVINYTVTNGDGCVTVATINFNVNALPVVAPITVVAPASTFDVCVGATINLTSSTPGGTWFVTGPPNIAAVNSAGLVTGIGDGTTTIRYRITNGNGCITNVFEDVHVHGLPVPTLSGANPICPGSTEIYTTEAGQVNYTWNVTGGTIIGPANTNTITVQWDMTGTKSIFVNYENGFGCTGATSATLTTSTGTVPTLTGISPVCAGDIVTYTTQSGQTDYTWSVSGGTITSGGTSTDETITINWNTVGNSSVSVNFTDVPGCTGANPTVKPIVVNAIPVLVTHDQAVCAPGSADLTLAAVTAGSSGGLTFTYWQDAAATTPYTTPAAAPAGTYYIKATSAANCFDIKAVSVTVNTAPSATINYASSPFCSSVNTGFVTHTGTTGGTYSAPAGLTINAITGNISPASSTPGTYTVTYTIQPSGGCLIYTTAASVTISAAPTATIGYGGTPYCANAGTVGVTKAGTTGGSYTSTSGLTIDPSTGAINTGSSTPGTYTVTYIVAASDGCAQFTTTTSVTITAAPSSAFSYSAATFCSSSPVASATISGTSGGTFTVTPGGLSLNPTTGAITPASSTAGTYAVKYAVTGNGGCANVETTVNVTVTAAPTATFTYTSNTFCVSASGAQDVTLTGTGAYTGGTYSAATGLSINSTTGAITPSTSTPNNYTITYTIPAANGCGTVPVTSLITISALPASFVITPTSASICEGDIQTLSASNQPPTSGTFTLQSATNTQTIPESNAAGLTRSINVSGIPAGANITSVTVTMNVTHPYDDDLVINLKAPNNNVLNLVDRRGGDGNNFTGTLITSVNGATVLNNTGAPFTGTYAADRTNGIGATGNVANQTTWTPLYGTPNGNWTLSLRDVEDCHGFLCFIGIGSAETGALNNWTITINYDVPVVPIAATWSPVTSLYTDAAATIPYTGQALSTVYTKPANGVITYTATNTNAANCSSTQTVTVTANPKPVVGIDADYCIVPGKVRLTAVSTPVAISYAWSNGATTQSIDVDLAGQFEVSAFGAGSCPGKAFINVADELIVNGDFELGNFGFASSLPYRTTAGSLNNPPGYAVDTAANFYGPSFLWGKDHTTGHGKFMMVNGQSTRIWEQTVTVQPNTTYYFSAWGLELDDLCCNPANAILQFNVNGVNTGTLANLPRPPANVTRDQDNNQWVRFYGSWTSGPTTTTAVVRIIDLVNATYGNNFGLDDISFGSLSTFITLESSPGTDAQVVCRNAPLTNITYNVGNGSTSGPNVTGLPAGVISAFSGDLLTISGTPTAPTGTYTYSITTNGTCNPITKTGTITVQGPTIVLSAGTTNTTVCRNVPMSKAYTLGGLATGATITALPDGITSSLSGNTFTISGTPTVVPGVYSYTITTTGGTCADVVITGSVTVQGATITLNSAPGTDAQSNVCISTPIVNIRYQVGGTATGGTVTGLPTGLIVNSTGGFITISGSPTQSGIFTYTVNSTGGACAVNNVTGTLTVTPAATITLTSATGTNAQNACFNLPITPITYAVSNATNATITSGALPAGVTGSFNAGVFTISGTPTAGGTFSYTITTSGGCATATASGTITIQAQTISLTSGQASPSLCANTTMGPIVYTVGGTASGASATGLPAGVSGSFGGGVFTLSGTPTDAPGTYKYMITTSGSCDAVKDSGVITITPAATGGNIASTATCSSASGTLTLTGHVGTLTRWEMSTDAGATWTNIVNTTITQAFTNIQVPTLYRAVITNSCGFVHSAVAAVSLSNYWTGETSIDWNDGSNWSSGVVPTTLCANVTIPAGTPFSPVLSSGISTITNLIIQTGATATVTGGTLQIGGVINNSGIFDVSTGTLVMNGTAPQSIGGNMFAGTSIRNLTLTNSADLTIDNTPGNLLHVSGTIAFGNVNNAIINTGNNLVLTSTATGTARVADVTNNGINNNNGFNGLVTVERYFPQRRAWRLFTAPVYGGGTVHANWQNGGVYTPGIGTYVSGTGATAPAGANGLDWSPYNNSSLKVTSSLTPVLNTNSAYLSTPSLTSAANIGYFIFVRGDRDPANTNVNRMNTTTLSSRGRLQTGVQTFTASPVTDAFTLIGNPYAAPVDFARLTKNNVADKIWLWDPYLNFEQGAYVTVIGDGAGNYSYAPERPGGMTNILQSGQAFFVQTISNNPASLVFEENDKSTTPTNLTYFRPTGINQALRTNLYNLESDSSTALLDGIYVQFDDRYSKAIDEMDAVKLGNVKEMLAVRQGNRSLAIERRPTLGTADTIYLRLTKTTKRTYRLEFVPTDLDPLLTGFIEDSYKGTKTSLSLSGKSVYDFDVNKDSASAAADRFRIVFKLVPPPPLPFVYTNVMASQKEGTIAVEWTVKNEKAITRYEVEKSTDGTNYTVVNSVAGTRSNLPLATYNWVDQQVLTGTNYYRIRNTNDSGRHEYSKTVLVDIQKGSAGMRVYPNPVTTGTIGVEFKNMPGGIYHTRLLNSSGQAVLSKTVNHAPGTSMEYIKMDYKLAAGLYHLEVKGPDNVISNIKVIIK